MADQKLSIILEAKDQASSIIQKAGGAIKDNLGKISAVAAVAATGIAAFGKSSVDAYVEAETAQRQLETSVIAVSGGTMKQVQAINAVSSALQQKSGIDADALNMGAAQLSTFGLQSESVVALTKSMADLTVNQAGVSAGSADYISSANIIAKALNEEFGALQKMGIRFTEHQKELIATGTEAQKVAVIQEALNQNLRETTDTVAGTAEALRGSFVQSLGEVQESIGKALLPAINSLMEGLKPSIDAFAKWAADNPELIATILKVTIAIAAAIAVLYPLSVAIGIVSTALAFLAANPIGLVIIAIAALVAGIIYLIKNWDEVKAKALEVWAAIQEYIATVTKAIGDKIAEFGNFIKDTIKAGMDAVAQVWSSAWEGMKGAFNTLTGGILTVIDGIVTKVGAAVNAIKELANAANAAASSVSGAAFGMSGSGGGGKKASSSGSRSGKPRASGGNVYAGQMYKVGEKGMEGFVPGMSGRIIPNNQMGGGGIVVNVNVSGNTVAGANIGQFAHMIGDILIKDLAKQTKLA